MQAQEQLAVVNSVPAEEITVVEVSFEKMRLLLMSAQSGTYMPAMLHG
jgi:hypothetical protein